MPVPPHGFMLSLPPTAGLCLFEGCVCTHTCVNTHECVSVGDVWARVQV